MTGADPADRTPAPLPRREARSILVHAAVDTAIAFLVLVVVLLILGVAFWAIVVIAVAAGVVAAPFTRRAEERALAARPEPDG